MTLLSEERRDKRVHLRHNTVSESLVNSVSPKTCKILFLYV